MKTTPKDLPAEWFDWLEACDFDQLSEAQQKIVLAVCEPEEYQELRQTYQLLQTDALLQTERMETATGEKPRWSLHVLRFWQAACVVLCCSTLYFAYRPAQQTTTEVARIVHDTIYQTVQAPALPDTPEQSVKPEHKRLVQHKIHKPIVQQHTLPPAEKQTTSGEVYVVEVHTLDDRRNQPKRNSRKNDSLERNFRFVRL